MSRGRARCRARRAAGARRFVHVSTAYVAGRSGPSCEDMLERAGLPEHVRADEVGGGADRRRRRAAWRSRSRGPSIVMGESDSGWTPAFNVLYWPLRAFARGLFDAVPGEAGGPRGRRAGRHVADGIVKLVESDATGRSTSSPATEARPSRSSPSWPARTSTARARRTCRRAAFGGRGGRRARRGVPAVLRHGRRVRRHPHARAARHAGRRALPGYFDTLMDYADRAKWGKRGTRARRRARTSPPPPERAARPPSTRAPPRPPPPPPRGPAAAR